MKEKDKNEMAADIERLEDEVENLESALRTFNVEDDYIDGIKRGEDYKVVLSEGAMRIVRERLRQIVVEGFDEESDDQHIHGDLAVYAAGLAVYGTDAILDDPRIDRTPATVEDRWGLIRKHKDDPVRMLEIAGALIAAELDRVLRQAG